MRLLKKILPEISEILLSINTSARYYHRKDGYTPQESVATSIYIHSRRAFSMANTAVTTAFGSLAALKENVGGSTDVLLRYYADQIEEQDILTDLTVSTPEKRTYTTQEPQVNFYGASDPNFPLTLNGQELQRNSEGVFSLEMDLEPGLNTFTFEHKEKSVVYKITREVVIIQEVSPSGSLTVEGSTQIGVTVMAYSGSTVTASLGGASVTLTEQELAAQQKRKQEVLAQLDKQLAQNKDAWVGAILTRVLGGGQ